LATATTSPPTTLEIIADRPRRPPAPRRKASIEQSIRRAHEYQIDVEVLLAKEPGIFSDHPGRL
jgi:hypothetical protein